MGFPSSPMENKGNWATSGGATCNGTVERAWDAGAEGVAAWDMMGFVCWMLKWTMSGKVMLCACLFVLYDWIGLYVNFLYCILFHCIVCYCIVFYCIVLHCFAWYRNVLQCTSCNGLDARMSMLLWLSGIEFKAKSARYVNDSRYSRQGYPKESDYLSAMELCCPIFGLLHFLIVLK